jgi:Fur family transcriptional regulator, ferric uptake regulator
MSRKQTPEKKPRLGQRNTRQRNVILEVIRSARGPLPVPGILPRAAEQIPGIGIATVYRTIKMLLEQGRVSAVILPTGETRYEVHGLSHHHHFQCTSCGQVFCMDFCPFAGPNRARLPGGFRVESHTVTTYGKCPECAAPKRG